MRPARRLVATLATALAVTVPLAACGDDDTSGPTATTVDPAGEQTTTTQPHEPLRVVLVNDDGIENPAIDVILDALTAEPGVEVAVVAPAEERSGTSDNLTEGGAPYERAHTPQGVDGWSVDGYPGDAVLVALDELDLDPHLVVSGVNPGQNVGPIAAISGTVGAGRIAVRQGVPALAVSAGIEFDEEQFAFAAELALDWIREHRESLVDGTYAPDTVTSINVPACPVDQMGELRSTELAADIPEGVDPFNSTCDLSDPSPDDDVSALAVGYPSITDVPPDLE